MIYSKTICNIYLIIVYKIIQQIWGKDKEIYQREILENKLLVESWIIGFKLVFKIMIQKRYISKLCIVIILIILWKVVYQVSTNRTLLLPPPPPLTPPLKSLHHPWSAYKSKILLWFWCPRCLNNHINLPDVIG